MKKLTLLLTVLISFSSHAYLVISDVDDTIKITNSGNLLQAAWRGVFTQDVFSGMSEIYKSWAADGAQIHFVTASPTILRNKIIQLLDYHKIQYATLTTRNNILMSKYRYKIERMVAIIDANPDQDVVLIGDDVGDDPEVFAELIRYYGQRILAVYVRPVRARELLVDQIPYITAYDIAITERKSERMGFDIVAKTAAAALTGEALKLMPEFTWCPSDLSQVDLPITQRPNAIGRRIISRIEKICGERQSAFENLSLISESR
jgi:hypothetical protein